ncbi:hypothetical protein [Methylobacterium gregans]|nr:hypothetical protein [Methylobacterium gregans]MDQ0523764.1 hypothetical protein [Methylobacterium gregans]
MLYAAAAPSNANVISLAEVRAHKPDVLIDVRRDLSLVKFQGGTSANPENASRSNGLESATSPIVPRSAKRARVPHAPRRNGATSAPSDAQVGRAELVAYIEGKTDRTLKKLFPKTAKEHRTIRDKTRRKNAKFSLDRSLHEFSAFLLELGSCPDDSFSVDRIDVLNLRYEPGNIRWASPRAQANNRANNVRITWRGESRTLADWARRTEIAYETLKKRWQRRTEGDQLFRGSKVLKYRVDEVIAPPVLTTACVVEAASKVTNPPPIAGPSCVGVSVPEQPKIGSDGWPEGIQGMRWDAGYQRFVSELKRRNGRANFTKAEFFAWIVGCQVNAARRGILARYPYIFFRDQLSAEDLMQLDSVARHDSCVKAFFQLTPYLKCALLQYVKERPADFNMALLRGLQISKPCIDPHDAVSIFPKEGSND